MDFYSKNFAWIILIAVAVAILSWRIPSNRDNFYIFAIFIVLFFALASRSDRLGNGLDGELEVRDELRKLPPEFIHIYDLKNDKGNVDFVVVCPKGIFIIEVKSGRWALGYYFKKGLKQAFAEARKVEEILKNKLGADFFVDPILMYSNKQAYLKFGFRPQKGVYVINLLWLQKFFNEYKTARELSQQEIDAIVNALKTSQKR